MRVFFSRAAFVLLAAVVSACSGNGAGTVPGPQSPAPKASSVASQPDSAAVAFSFVIPARASSASTGRRPAFVSASTQGISVAVYAHPRGTSAPVASFAIDLSASSNACTTATSGARTCMFTLPLPGGSYDLVDTLYDASPSNGTFAASANVLGIGTSTQTIVLHQNNAVTVSIGGVVTSLKVGPRTVVVDSASSTSPLTVTALDADGNTILGGTADPYENAVTLSVSDTGGNHTMLSLNGAAPSATITTTQSSDAISAVYDGAANAGYYATFTASASGATSASTTLDSFDATLTLVSFLQSTDSQIETITEPHNTAPFTVTPAYNCPGVTNASTVAGTGSVETFTLTPGANAGTCFVTAASETGTASVPVKVVNLVPGVTTIPAKKLYATSGQSIVAYDVAHGGTLVQTISGSATTFQAVEGIGRDSTGRILVADLTGNIDFFPADASGNVAPSFVMHKANTGLSLPFFVGADRAGDVIVASDINGLETFAAGNLDAAPLFSSQFCSYGGIAFPTGFAVDPGGTAFVSSAAYSTGGCGAGVQIIPYLGFGPSRTISDPFSTESVAQGGVAIDAADDTYILDYASGKFGKFAPDAFGTATPTLTGTGLTQPTAIAVDTDGTVYVVNHPSSGSSQTTQIAVFAPGATTPTSTFPIGTTFLYPRISL